MTRTENRLVQAALHATALASLGHGAQQQARKRFITMMKSGRRSRTFAEARMIYADLLQANGFTNLQIADTIGRSKQAVAYYHSAFIGLSHSDMAFREKAIRARQEFMSLMSL